MEKLTQKLFIDKLSRSKDISRVELAKHLELEPNSLDVTLRRDNLMFKQFCDIYKYIYGVDFKVSDSLTHVMRDLKHDIKLCSAVEIMENNKTPIIVILYKKTKIRLINIKD